MEEILNNWLQEKPKDKFDKELHKYTYYDLMEFAEYYHTLQLKRTSVSGSFYEIKIDKEDSEIINEKLFEPKIQKFLDSTSVCCYLNFPKIWANWELPKRLHKKDLKIISFDNTKIVVGW